jgi:hypothetical protein
MTRTDKLAACARAAHDVAHTYNRAIGDTLSPPWEDLTSADKAGRIRGAEHAINGGTPEASHQLWIETRVAEGWVYGPEKNYTAKTSPCLVPYAELPEHQRRKDALFQSVVRAMWRALDD